MSPSRPSPPAVEIRHLAIRDSQGVEIVADISLTLARGEILVLVGETGSGKSLIAQAILGLLPVGFSAGGSLTLGDNPPIDLADAGVVQLHWARETMLLPQEPRAALDPTMRVGKQLAEAAMADFMKSEAALAAVDLPARVGRNYPFELSGGMAQRVLVATALVGNAPFVIADEPTKGLDAVRVSQTRDLLKGLANAGRALLVITHDIGLARELATSDGTTGRGQFAVLHRGRLVERGDGQAVFLAPSHPYTRAWIEADPARWPNGCCDGIEDSYVLHAHGLSFAHPGGVPLFTGLDIHLRAGGILGVAGPSGCGKTSLGNVLLGLQAPASGWVKWDGFDPHHDPEAKRRLRQKYQKLHQDPATAFLASRTIGMQFADLADVLPVNQVARELPALLDGLGLSPQLLNRYPGEVSGGEAQRLALARILLLKPAVIVADEPTSRLDPIVQKQIIDLLRRFVERDRIGLVLISHDRHLLCAVAQRTLDLGARETALN